MQQGLELDLTAVLTHQIQLMESKHYRLTAVAMEMELNGPTKYIEVDAFKTQ